MPSQIFKNPVPNELLKQLFDENAVKTETGYIINNCVYKKIISESDENDEIDENDVIPMTETTASSTFFE